MSNSIRIDKWLWAVRIFKTRNQAAEACKSGKVTIKGDKVKPSREIKINDVIIVKIAQLTKTIKAIGLVKNRVSAKLAPDYVEDLTSEQEYKRYKLIRKSMYEKRDLGIGRPTKKQRRLIDKLKKLKNKL